MKKDLKKIENKIAEAQKQLEEAKRELQEYRKVKKLQGVEIGGSIEIAGLTWTVIDKTEKGYLCLGEKMDEDMQFDSSCNDWRKSKLRDYLNTVFYQRIAADIGEENLLEFERNLLSLDGQTEYGLCEDKVSLLNVDEYRRYRKQIANAGYWWWTLTPDTTACNENSSWVRVVSPSGDFGSNFYYDFYGVRPFCIFKSSIFESEEE